MSGNYQSRVFTFISKRTNRFKDTCAQGFRHIKVAVVWSGQALLYPFHLLSQTTKIFRPQIEPPEPKPVLPPVPDINIEQALALVVDAGYPIVIAERGSVTNGQKSDRQLVSSDSGAIVASEDSSSLGYYDPDTDDWEVSSYSPYRSQTIVAKKPVIQGLSSLLFDRQLVLITTENEILDILTSAQQQEIRRRIGIDVAIDWYQWSTGEILDHYAPLQLSFSQQINTPEQLAIEGSEDRSTPNLFDQLQDWFKNLTGKPESAIVRSNNLDIEQIDRSEPNKSTLLQQIVPASYIFTPQPPSIDRFLDLPQLPPINDSEPLAIITSSIQQKLIELQPEWLRQWWSYYRDYLAIPITGFNEFETSQIIHQPAEFQLTEIAQPRDSKVKEITKTKRFGTSETITLPPSSEINHNYQSTQNHGKLDRKIFQDVEFDPDWIETAAEQIGYSKSPIAKLLEWIDLIFLTIEIWLIKAWNVMNNKSEI